MKRDMYKRVEYSFVGREIFNLVNIGGILTTRDTWTQSEAQNTVL